MGMCRDCGKIANSREMIDRLCPICQDPALKAQQIAQKQEIEEQKSLEEEKRQNFLENKNEVLKSIMITTETSLNLNIEERLEVISVSRIYGLNILKDFFSGIRDIVGGRINSLEDPLQKSHKEIIEEMKELAYYAGANAIIAFKIEHAYNNNNGSILSVFATATMVKIK